MRNAAMPLFNQRINTMYLRTSPADACLCESPQLCVFFFHPLAQRKELAGAQFFSPSGFRIGWKWIRCKQLTVVRWCLAVTLVMSPCRRGEGHSNGSFWRWKLFWSNSATRILRCQFLVGLKLFSKIVPSFLLVFEKSSYLIIYKNIEFGTSFDNIVKLFDSCDWMRIKSAY